jgi:dihydrolipoamide dehydrogenase
MPLLVTVIGAGPGGYVAAIRAAQRGARVTVIEDSEVGGTCLNRGCIPTKTLLASAEALEQVRNAAGMGIDVPGAAAFNLVRIRERKDKVVATQVRGIRELLKRNGVTLIAGRGSLLAEDVVRAVGQDGVTQDIRSDKIIIATGSRPARLAGIPFDGERIITSDEAVQMASVPKRLLIIGAGVIGCEFAFIYRALGTEVTLVEVAGSAVATEDREISELLEREMKKAKIKLLVNAKAESVSTTPEGVAVVLSGGREIVVDQVLVSIGRSLNADDVGCEDVGVSRGVRGEISVNGRMETNIPGIFAIGDVTGKVLLAHVATRQGLVAATNATGGDERMEYDAVPSAIFTMPEIGSVGLREQDAAGKGIAVKVGRFPYRGLGKSHAIGAISGIFKIVADAGTDKVLGVHICGAHASDLVHEGVLAIRMGATSRQLGEMIHAHPTLSEGILEAAEDVHGLSIHTPPVTK